MRYNTDYINLTKRAKGWGVEKKIKIQTGLFYKMSFKRWRDIDHIVGHFIDNEDYLGEMSFTGSSGSYRLTITEKDGWIYIDGDYEI